MKPYNEISYNELRLAYREESHKARSLPVGTEEFNKAFSNAMDLHKLIKGMDEDAQNALRGTYKSKRAQLRP